MRSEKRVGKKLELVGLCAGMAKGRFGKCGYLHIMRIIGQNDLPPREKKRVALCDHYLLARPWREQARNERRHNIYYS